MSRENKNLYGPDNKVPLSHDATLTKTLADLGITTSVNSLFYFYFLLPFFF